MKQVKVVMDRIFDINSERLSSKWDELRVEIIKNVSNEFILADKVNTLICYKKNLQDWDRFDSKIENIIVIDDNSLNFSNILDSKLFIIPQSEYHEDSVVTVVRAFLLKENHQFKEQIDKRLASDSKVFLKMLKNNIKDFTFDKNDQKKVQELLVHEQAIFSSLDYLKAVESFNESMIQYFGEIKVSIVNFFEVDLVSKTKLYFSSTYKGFPYCYCIENMDELSSLDVFSIGRLIYAHLDFLDQIESNKQNNRLEHTAIYDVFLQKLDYPYAMFMQGELVKYNQAFIHLGLVGRDCLKINNHEKVTIDDKVYEVIINVVEINQQKHHLYFFQYDRVRDEMTFSPSNEELGIVSSSIAHELNNPLAGILAAIDVLLMDDNLTVEIMDDLKEIKNGAVRCKHLVETFLGFSRANPLRTSQPKLDLSLPNLNISSFHDSLERALSLLRFRLIESNIKLETQFIEKEGFSGSVNPSIFAMILYLCLGNLVTNYSHYLLIAIELKDHPLKLEFIENKNSFSICIRSDIHFDPKTIVSKLTEHLLEMENFLILFKERVMVFKMKDQLSL